MDALVFSLGFFVVCSAILLICRVFDPRISLPMVLLAALVLGMDDLLTGLASSVPGWALLGGNWNWSGKLYSLVLSIVVILALRIDRRAVGLVWEQRTPWLSVVSVLGFIAWGAALGLVFRPGEADAETLAFQVSMPGLAEELMVRGVIPALLLGALWRRPLPDGRYWPVIVATSLIFGIWHSAGYSNGQFRFDLMSGLFPFIGSLAGGWLRFRTGSLLVPVLGHGLANLAFHVAGGLAA